MAFPARGLGAGWDFLERCFEWISGGRKTFVAAKGGDPKDGPLTCDQESAGQRRGRVVGRWVLGVVYQEEKFRLVTVAKWAVGRSHSISVVPWLKRLSIEQV